MEIRNSVFADNLRYYLELRHKTQADLAKALGVSTSTVSYWASGTKIPRADKLAAICGYLNAEMNDLLLERTTTPSFEEEIFNKYKAMFRNFGELSEDDKQIVEDLIERLRGGEEN